MKEKKQVNVNLKMQRMKNCNLVEIPLEKTVPKCFCAFCRRPFCLLHLIVLFYIIHVFLKWLFILCDVDSLLREGLARLQKN